MDCLEEKINAAPLVPATTSSAESTDRESAPRRRKTPPVTGNITEHHIFADDIVSFIQHQVRMIHSSFDEDKQLKADEVRSCHVFHLTLAYPLFVSLSASFYVP